MICTTPEYSRCETWKRAFHSTVDSFRGGYVFVVNEDTCCAGAVEGERFGFLAGGERAAVEMKNGAPARKLARRRALARSRIFVRVSKMRFGFVWCGGSECTCVLVRWEKDLGGRSRQKFWARDLARLGKGKNGGRKELR